MLDVIAIVLIVAWLLGVVSTYTFGGAIHVLLVVVVGMIAARWRWLKRPPR